MRGLKIGVAGVVLMLCVGCGSSITSMKKEISHRLTSSQVVRLQAAAGGSRCTIYASGTADQISFASSRLDVEPMCQQVTQHFARQGLLWTPDKQQSDLSTPQTICDLTDPRSGIQAIATGDSADPDHQADQAACAGLLASGWTNATP